MLLIDKKAVEAAQQPGSSAAALRLVVRRSSIKIWISKIAKNFAEVVAALIHEALHDSVFVLRSTRDGHRRVMSCHDEHCVMRELGCPIGV